MVDNFTYDLLLQVCQEVEGKQVKAKEKNISIINTVKNVMRKNDVSSFGILCMLELWCIRRRYVCVIGYNESTVMHKKEEMYL